MTYEYSGYLKTLLDHPDSAAAEAADAVVFTAEDLERWATTDTTAEKEWQHTPARIKRTGDILSFTGRFEMVRRIDNLDKEDPSFWVPLSSGDRGDARFPVDLSRFPIAEITYRCSTPWCRPAWMFNYEGGTHFDGLLPVREWRTIARRIPHFGFPQTVNSVTVRLYSVSRSTETLEIKSIRFRAMTPQEEAVCTQEYQVLTQSKEPRHFPLLDEFMPFGVYITADSARQMAETMDISFLDYWRIALEDVARHRHNCVVVEETSTITRGEWDAIYETAEHFGIRCFVLHDWPIDSIHENPAAIQELIEERIAPYKDSKAVLAWALSDEPPDHSFPALREAQKMLEKADTNHPMAVMMRDPNSFPLLSRFFPATGLAFYKSRVPWEIGQLVERHLPVSHGQQLWVTAPTFVYATDTPEWSSCPELRLMLNTALGAGARGWFSFAYNNTPIWMGGHCQRSLTGPFLTFSDLWDELSQRVERLSALAPLFLRARPCGRPGLGVQIEAQFHPRSHAPAEIGPIQEHWLHGPDFDLLYLISNDTSEVASVNVQMPAMLGRGLEACDLTDFVRRRVWSAMHGKLHIEMVPGQSTIILFAEAKVCTFWRDRITENIVRSDHRQISLDMELTRRFQLGSGALESLLEQAMQGSPHEQLAQTVLIREALANTFYNTAEVCETQSKLIQISAALCGCDGALCRLLGKGKADMAHEMGLKMLPFARELARLRLEFRQGVAQPIYEDCEKLAAKCISLLHSIRTAS